MVFRSFSKLHPNGPVPHQISPPSSHFIKNPVPKNLPFQPCGRRVSPIQAASFHLQSGDGECLPATQLYLSVFTCPTVSLNLPSDAGASPPARRPYLFHPTASEAYPSRPRAFSSGRMFSESLLATQLAFLSLPVQHSESKSPVGRRREHSRPDNLTFQTCCSTRLTRPTRRF